jgi:hypothetical protein
VTRLFDVRPGTASSSRGPVGARPGPRPVAALEERLWPTGRQLAPSGPPAPEGAHAPLDVVERLAPLMRVNPPRIAAIQLTFAIDDWLDVMEENFEMVRATLPALAVEHEPGRGAVRRSRGR